MEGEGRRRKEEGKREGVMDWRRKWRGRRKKREVEEGRRKRTGRGKEEEDGKRDEGKEEDEKGEEQARIRRWGKKKRGWGGKSTHAKHSPMD